MISRLRIRLITASMLSLLIVLTSIIGGVNILNYRGIVDDADSVLYLLKDGGGKFPSAPEQAQWRETGPRFRSPELKFETRFFSVTLDERGEIVSSDMGRIAAVDAQSAESFATLAISQTSDSGFVNIYRYLRYDEDGKTRILFLDCGRMLAGFHSVLLSSISVSLAGLIAVLVLMLLLSGRIIKPVLDSYEKQKRFITDAGHEIKTPITIIDADAELLEMEFGRSEWLDDIRTQSARLTALTADLITLSRMEEAEQIQMIDFPLSDLVSETCISFQTLARTRNRHMELSIQPMLSFYGNEKNIQQLISLLLDNAVKYSNEGGNIRLCLEKQSKSIVLTVENTVDTISQDTVRNMFERFYRSDPSRNSAVKGYGIGLSIARAIVAAHKGKIHAESPDGHFLKITVSFPQ